MHVSQGQQLGMHDIHTHLSDKSSVYGGVQFEDEQKDDKGAENAIIINPLTSKTGSLSDHPTRKVKLETRIHRWRVDQVKNKNKILPISCIPKNNMVNVKEVQELRVQGC